MARQPIRSLTQPRAPTGGSGTFARGECLFDKQKFTCCKESAGLLRSPPAIVGTWAVPSARSAAAGKCAFCLFVDIVIRGSSDRPLAESDDRWLLEGVNDDVQLLRPAGVLLVLAEEFAIQGALAALAEGGDEIRQRQRRLRRSAGKRRIRCSERGTSGRPNDEGSRTRSWESGAGRR